MPSERAERVARIFDEAAALEADARPAYLDDACGDDAALRAEIESLLREDEHAGTFMETPAAAAADEALAARDEQRLVGRTIDDYRIIQTIGRGGMSVVYLAEQEQPRRRVALKLIRPGRATPALLRRFEHESQILARLQHPGIAPVYGAGTADTGAGPQPYFAMEYIEGLSLTKYAERHDLTARARLKLMVDVAEAVHHAHQKGVVHRDLKPGNILVDASGRPKVLDFGVARATDSDVQMTTIETAVGELIGTIPYMSPEQVSGDPLMLDTRSDIYGLGVVAYELLAGRLPYDVTQRTIHEAVRVIREDEPVPLSSVNRVFRGDIETIIGRALEKEPDRRYQSAQELAADVLRYLNDQPIVARPASTLYQLRKFARRNRGLVAGVALAFLVLIAGIVATTWQAIEAGTARDEAVTAKEEQTRLRTLAEDRLTEAETVTQFLTDMLAAADPAEAGKDVRVIDVLDGAAGRIVDDFADRPRIDVALRVTLGTTYLALGEHAKAEAQLTLARDRGRAELAPDDRLTLKATDRLGVTHYYQGRWADAERNFAEALDIRRRTLGEEDPDTLSSINNLASVQRQQGKLEDAEPLYAELLEMAKRVLGPEHRNTMICMDNLASIYIDQERWSDAEPIYLESFRLTHEVLGDDDPTTLATRNNLAGLYIKQKRFDEAAVILEETILTSGRALGDDHAVTMEATHRMAATYAGLEAWDEAAALFRATLERRRGVLGGNHLDTLQTLTSLTGVLVERGDYAEAEPLALEARERYEEASGPDHPRTRKAARQLVTLYEAWGKPEQAAEWREPDDEETGEESADRP